MLEAHGLDVHHGLLKRVIDGIVAVGASTVVYFVEITART